MVGEIITDIQALDVTILAELLKQVFIEILEVVLDLARVQGLGLGLRVDTRSEHVGPLVHVGEEEGRADGGLGVET